MTSVLIIENHEAFGERLQTFVRDQLHCSVVGLGADAAAGLELARETRPDFALVDIGLPGESGLALARLLRDRHPEVRVVLMSDGESSEYVDAATQVGAIAYLSKVAVSQRLPGLLGKSLLSTGPQSAAETPKKTTSRRGLVLEGGLAGATLMGGLALSQPLAAIAGAAGILLLSRWHSTLASRPSRTGGTALIAATAPGSQSSGLASRADGVRGSPERSAHISDSG